LLDLGCLVNRLKEEHVRIQYPGHDDIDMEGESSHELPDGSVIHIPNSVSAHSGELLFEPREFGIRDERSVTGKHLLPNDLNAAERCE